MSAQVKPREEAALSGDYDSLTRREALAIQLAERIGKRSSFSEFRFLEYLKGRIYRRGISRNDICLFHI